MPSPQSSQPRRASNVSANGPQQPIRATVFITSRPGSTGSNGSYDSVSSTPTSPPQRIRTRPLVGAPPTSPPPQSRSSTPVAYVRTASPAPVVLSPQTRPAPQILHQLSTSRPVTSPTPPISAPPRLNRSYEEESSSAGMILPAYSPSRSHAQQSQPVVYAQQTKYASQQQLFQVASPPTPNAVRIPNTYSTTPPFASQTPPRQQQQRFGPPETPPANVVPSSSRGSYAEQRPQQQRPIKIVADLYQHEPSVHVCPHCGMAEDQPGSAEDGIPMESHANDRVLRKIMDLEISNTSLMAVNSSLEHTIRKQAQTIERLKSKARGVASSPPAASSNGVDIPALSSSGSPIELFAESMSEFDAADDLYMDDSALPQDLPPNDTNVDEDGMYQRLCDKMQQLIAEASHAVHASPSTPPLSADIFSEYEPLPHPTPASWMDDGATLMNTPFHSDSSFPDEPVAKMQSVLSSVLDLRQRALTHDRVLAGVVHQETREASARGGSVSVPVQMFDQMLELLSEVRLETVLAWKERAGSPYLDEEEVDGGWSDRTGGKPAPARGAAAGGGKGKTGAATRPVFVRVAGGKAMGVGGGTAGGVGGKGKPVDYALPRYQSPDDVESTLSSAISS
ncbi:hypothetical protein BJ742DRAFT_766819 [Cladochytrium replicatum]|nr:hypothetical protein BJ742DRAFT_766819 [Cladochytrium replicatum]